MSEQAENISRLPRDASNQERIDADWRVGLRKKGQQATYIGDERNVLGALRAAPDLCGLIRFDMFALTTDFMRSPPWRHVEVGERWTDDDDTALMSYLQDHDIAVRSKNVVSDCVSLVAKDASVHPVREYLNALEWDGRDRIDWWLEVYLGAKGNPDYLTEVGRSWLISAVARIEQPGCQADHMLVLEAIQGAGKSRAARTLAICPAWFADSIGDLRSKDSALQLCGKWVIELSELVAVRRADVEQVKGYISRTQDVYRPPYSRRAATVPRQCVFIGTTNEREYLRDRTGNRRYWPVRCEAIDIAELERDREQLWAEAVHAYRAGRLWYLDERIATHAATEQDQRVRQSELETNVAEYLDRIGAEGADEVTTRQIFEHALGLDPSSGHYIEQTVRLGALVAAAIERTDWSRAGKRGRGKSARTVYRRCS